MFCCFRSSKLIVVALCLSAPIAVDARAETIKAPEIMPRKKWEIAKQPFNTNEMQPQPVFKSIVIHSTGTLVRLWKSKTAAQKMQDYHDSHLRKRQEYREEMKGAPWGGFAYHYFIDTDGTIAEGRSLEYLGDSGTDYDMSRLILVVLEGNFEGGPTNVERAKLEKYKGAYTGEPKEVEADKNLVSIDLVPDRPTEVQKKKLDALVAWLSKRHKIAPSTIKGHKEMALGIRKTDCPGEHLMSYLPSLKAHAIKALVEDERQ